MQLFSIFYLVDTVSLNLELNRQFHKMQLKLRKCGVKDSSILLCRSICCILHGERIQ